MATVEEMKAYLKQGQFPPGSMGPKIQAAIEYIEGGGKEVLITSANKLRAAVERKAGTRIIPGGKDEKRPSLH